MVTFLFLLSLFSTFFHIPQSVIDHIHGDYYVVDYESDVSWTEAKNYCVNNYGTSLISIKSSVEEEAVEAAIAAAGLSSNSVWLGGEDPNNDGTYTWTEDGSSISYENWDNQDCSIYYEPNGVGRCVLKYATTGGGDDCGTWKTLLCSTNFETGIFLCYAPTPSPSVDGELPQWIAATDSTSWTMDSVQQIANKSSEANGFWESVYIDTRWSCDPNIYDKFNVRVDYNCTISSCSPVFGFGDVRCMEYTSTFISDFPGASNFEDCDEDRNFHVGMGYWGGQGFYRGLGYESYGNINFNSGGFYELRLIVDFNAGTINWWVNGQSVGNSPISGYNFGDTFEMGIIPMFSINSGAFAWVKLVSMECYEATESPSNSPTITRTPSVYTSRAPTATGYLPIWYPASDSNDWVLNGVKATKDGNANHYATLYLDTNLVCKAPASFFKYTVEFTCTQGNVNCRGVVGIGDVNCVGLLSDSLQDHAGSNSGSWTGICDNPGYGYYARSRYYNGTGWVDYGSDWHTENTAYNITTTVDFVSGKVEFFINDVSQGAAQEGIDFSASRFSNGIVALVSMDSSDRGTVTLHEWVCTYPTREPTGNPSSNPSDEPSVIPTRDPSMQPSILPTNNPSFSPSPRPTMNPSTTPSNEPTGNPTVIPSDSPSVILTIIPSVMPSVIPTVDPSNAPTVRPTEDPSVTPSRVPTNAPSINQQSPQNDPTTFPSSYPTMSQNPASTTTTTTTNSPSSTPHIISVSNNPSLSPQVLPTNDPSVHPTVEPTNSPIPSLSPTNYPSNSPVITNHPSNNPTNNPVTLNPTNSPTKQPTNTPLISSLKKGKNSSLLSNELSYIIVGVLSIVLIIVLFLIFYFIKRSKKKKSKTTDKNIKMEIELNDKLQKMKPTKNIPQLVSVTSTSTINTVNTPKGDNTPINKVIAFKTNTTTPGGDDINLGESDDSSSQSSYLDYLPDENDAKENVTSRITSTPGGELVNSNRKMTNIKVDVVEDNDDMDINDNEGEDMDQINETIRRNKRGKSRAELKEHMEKKDEIFGQVLQDGNMVEDLVFDDIIDEMENKDNQLLNEGNGKQQKVYVTASGDEDFME